MAIYGTGGSGKSAALRGIAIAAAVTPRGGPVHVYGIDCGSSGLKMLDGLPHVGEIINGDDVERVGGCCAGSGTSPTTAFRPLRRGPGVHHRGVPAAGQPAGREADLRPGGRHVRVPRSLRIQPPVRAVGHLPAAGHRRPSPGHPPGGHRRPPQLRPGVAACLHPAAAGAAPVLRGRLHVPGRPQGRPQRRVAARARPAGRAGSPACRAGRQLEPGAAGARSATSSARPCSARAWSRRRRSSGSRSRWTWTSCPPAAPDTPGHRRRRRNAAAGRDHGQGPAAAGRPSGRRPDRGAGHPGLRPAPLQPARPN